MICNKVIGLSLFTLIATSCSVETLGYGSNFYNKPQSFVGSTQVAAQQRMASLEQKVDRVKYLSDLTNTLESFPSFSYNEANKSVKELKMSLQNYVYGITESNPAQRDDGYESYKKSYETLQKVKKRMNGDEAELLDRYLIKIKANVNAIEYLSK